MPTINPAIDNTLTVLLRAGGAPAAVSAPVTARFFTADGLTPLTPVVAASGLHPMADWPHGVVAFEFAGTDTVGITQYQARLVVYAGAESWDFLYDVDVPGGTTALYPSRSEAIAAVRASLPADIVLTDDAIWVKLTAAEADVARQLRVFLRPTYILPAPAPVTDTAVVPPGMPWVEEPGYDYEPDLFQGEGWGYLVTRHRPIISVDYVQFAYPQPLNTVWNLPMEWVRLDRKYGHIRIVPAGASYSAPFSAWMMQVLGGGRTIPQMIRIRYRAGLENAAAQYPDLLDVVQKMAVLRAFDEKLPGTSESVSADGLSQSRTIDLAGYRQATKDKLSALSEAIHGVRMLVV